MVKTLTPIHMGGSLPEGANRMLLHAASVLSYGIFYVFSVGMVWLMGQWHHFLYGNDFWLVDQLAVRNPWLTCAVVFAVTAVVSASPFASHVLDGPTRRRTFPEAVAAVDAGALYDSAIDATRGPRPDLDLAHERLAAAHAAGSADAAYALANWHARGIVVQRDVGSWERLLREAAASDVPAALYDLALARRDGIGVKADPMAAYHGFLRAALFGHPLAAQEVASCLERGIGTYQDEVAATAWRDAKGAVGDRGLPGGAWPWDVARG
jgi:hypothetical protein